MRAKGCRGNSGDTLLNSAITYYVPLNYSEGVYRIIHVLTHSLDFFPDYSKVPPSKNPLRRKICGEFS